MAEKQKHFGKKNWLVNLTGDNVVVVFWIAKMSGKLLDVTQYELILKNNKIDSPIIIPKHAVKYVYGVAESNGEDND
ncbi:hypothetical protein [Enterococcus faecium]|uniref:hypothetical protein n=1 Tax=Enterococcus faecium TaxID=1352 RepID=UPI0018E7EE28|nr:hypothetical protein [Enterococcus faecium]MBJ2328146.1 hypothetical protein [Enterococcus faecium]